jgi:hypothetical protein
MLALYASGILREGQVQTAIYFWDYYSYSSLLEASLSQFMSSHDATA